MLRAVPLKSSEKTNFQPGRSPVGMASPEGPDPAGAVAAAVGALVAAGVAFAGVGVGEGAGLWVAGVAVWVGLWLAGVWPAATSGERRGSLLDMAFISPGSGARPSPGPS